jgi:hypothetical protein
MNSTFAIVQSLRALVNEKYQWALGTNRYDWLAVPLDEDQSMVLRLNINLNEVVSNGKLGKLRKLELLSTALGWNAGASADSMYRAYEEFKKKLPKQKGAADRAFDEILTEASRVWGLSSTKDLWLAEISALIGWMEEHGGAEALKAIAPNPRMWVEKLARLEPVRRPENYIPPAVLTKEEAVLGEML